MNQELAGVILAVAALGAIGSAFMGLIAMYKRDVKKIHEKYKDKPKKELEPKQVVPQKDMGLLQSIFWCIVAYWGIFAGIIHWLSGDSELSETTFWAPVLLPLFWIWSVVSNEKTWYVVGAMFAIWIIYYEVIQPIISRLDRIIELLSRRDY